MNTQLDFQVERTMTTHTITRRWLAAVSPARPPEGAQPPLGGEARSARGALVHALKD